MKSKLSCQLPLIRLLLSLTIGAGGGPLVQAADSPVLKVGFAERDISPEIGMEQPGNYGKSFHQKFHDPCKVRAAVFDNGQMRVALVGTDTLMIPRALVLAARQAISARCGIAPEAVLVGASHSHSSGPVGFVQPGEYDHASALVRQLAYEKSPCAEPEYLQRVEREIVNAVCQANDQRAPAVCGFGSGHEDKVAFNRRLRMKGGQTFSHPGKGNPEIFDYAGPIDPEVGVVSAWDLQGKFLGCIVNYACHATTSPGGISANWIYYLEQTIQGALGSKAPIVFLQGASGDVTQVDNLSPYANPSGEAWAQMVGGRVGAEAVKVQWLMAKTNQVRLEAKSKVWRINRRVPDPDRVRRSREIVQQDPNEIGATEWTFAKEILLLDALLAKEKSMEVEVQAIQIGPAVFVSNPAEFFVQLGLDIKAGSPFRLTYPVELANGCVGYVPTEEAFGPQGGGYETRLTSYSNLEITAGRQMVEAGLELIRQMKPEPLPEPAKAPPFIAPWAYGNVKPEVR